MKRSVRLQHHTSQDRFTEADARQLLCLLREHESLSAREIERRLQLPRSRSLPAMQLLRKKGLLAGPQLGQSRGRATHFRLNRSCAHVIGVDIGGTNLRVVLADMSGATLGRWTTSTGGACSPAAVIQKIKEGVQHLLRSTSTPRASLLAVAAGVPGITDAKAGVVIMTSYLGGWRNVPFHALLKSSLHVPVAIENDVRMAAIGENWRGAAKGVADFVFLAIGTGIAAGIFVNGQILHGTESIAGEVGYMFVPGTSVAAVERGAPGALESAIGGEGIKERWQLARNSDAGADSGNLNATEIFDRGAKGDPAARKVLEEAAQILAYAIYDISLLLNCRLFVLGGGVGANASLRDATQHVLEKYSEPVKPKLTLSSLGQEAQLFGAIRLALDRADSRILAGA